jgi:hypothetical protein
MIVLGFVLGLIAALLGQWFAHRLTSARERRADLIATLDRAIASLVAGEHAVQQFIAKAGTSAPPRVVQEAADKVSAQEVDMSAAFVSLRVRLGHLDPLVLALNEAQDRFIAAYMATAPALTKGEAGQAPMAAAFDAVGKFKDACDEALGIASKRFGQSKQ